jgi:hypothetical protein
MTQSGKPRFSGMEDRPPQSPVIKFLSIVLAFLAAMVFSSLLLLTAESI